MPGDCAQPAALVAVAVVSWNTRDLLVACLESMRAEADTGRLDVWVVDNGSGDGSVEAVREGFPWVRLVVAERNLGFGAAVNLVAARTATTWIAPANADVQLEAGALGALLAAAEADPGAGAVAPKLVLPDGSVQPSIQPFPSLRLALLRNLHVHRVSRGVAERLCLRGAWEPERGARADWATGAFMIVRRAAWDAVGGFDAEQWMYSEDLDLCWRLHRAGWGVRYEPRAVVHHVHGASAAQAFGDEAEQALRWSATTYGWVARRRGVTVAWALAALNLTGSAARLAAVRAAEIVSGRDLAVVRRRARRGLRLHRLGLRSRTALLRSR
jgi:N-acetylglucosaminyl-diphospho-decaprenol L-rhamnosyltransferase